MSTPATVNLPAAAMDRAAQEAADLAADLAKLPGVIDAAVDALAERLALPRFGPNRARELDELAAAARDLRALAEDLEYRAATAVLALGDLGD